MLYLDFSLYLIIIILLCILINKVYVTKEGFNHKGEGVLAATKKNTPIKTDDSDVGRIQNNQKTLVIQTTKETYNIADILARMILRAPYDFLSRCLTLGMNFAANMKDIFRPIYDFYKDLYRTIRDFVKKLFNKWLSYVKKGFNIMRNLPKFIKEQANKIIDLFQTFFKKIFDLLKTIGNSLQKIFKVLINLPMEIFTIITKLIDIIVNLVLMIVKLPASLLNMIVSLQEQGMDLMDKGFNIPFMDLFFK